MKPTSTLHTLAVGSLLLAGILTGCKKDPPQVPTEIFTMSSNKMPALNASKKQAYSIINTFAGSDIRGYSGDGGLVKNALLNSPQNVYADKQGNVYISDLGNNVFRKVDAKSGIISTVAGNGINGFSGDGGLATQASFSNAFHIVSDDQGNLYISDLSNSRIRRIDAKTGIVQTIAGTGLTDFNGDGNKALATNLNIPFGIVIDKEGNLVFSDSEGLRLRKMDMRTKIITTIAGTGDRGFGGDGGPATAAMFNFIWNVTVDPVCGDIYVSDQFNCRIRKIDHATGIITTVAGNGIQGNSGMGGLASSASFVQPVGIAVDKQGNLFISDQVLSQVYVVDKRTGIINLVAGNNGNSGFSGDGGPSVNALLSWTNSLSFGPDGGLYVNDANNNRVRKITGLTAGH
jgi:sugar lactone lactonase YvrE